MTLDEEAERRSLCEWQPHLKSSSFEVKSPSDRRYNCVGWVAGDNTKIWSPAVAVGGKMLGGYYWPDYAPMLPTVTAVEAVFEHEGYVRTAVGDTAVEAGVHKIAIFGYDSMGLVTHAARQCASGLWTSKMGDCADIEHTLRDIEGGIFGEVRSVMRKDTKVDPSLSDRSPRLIVVERSTSARVRR